MDRDEKISYLLSGIGVLWMFGGLVLLALVAQWLRAWGIASPWLEKGLVAFYLAALWIVGLGALFFRFRGSLRSGSPATVFLIVLQLLMAFLIGRAVLRLLGGG
jgi:cation transport ATPase